MASFIQFTIIILQPLSIVLRFIVNSISKIIGSKKKKIHISVLEELRGTLRFHSDVGNVNKHDFHMLDGLLDLEKLPLKGVMIHRKYIYSIDITEPVDKIISKAFSSGYSKIPLWQDKQDNIVAVLDVKLLLKLLATNIEYSKIKIEEITIKPWFVPETTSLKKQLAAFREECSYFAIVVDEYGDFRGVITLRDIIEEIVGILQEEEQSDSSISKNEDGSFIVSADYSVRDFVRLTDFNISNNISTTIGGIVVNIARHIPEPGEEIIFKKYKFTVIEKNGKRLSKILISPLIKK
jgi:Mg2+/Co2+ transporter CorB